MLKWDTALFEFINNDLSNPYFNMVMPWLREPLFWLPVYVFIIGFLFFNFGRKAYWVVIFAILTASSSDMISSRAIKYTVKRLRPCNTEQVHVIRRVHCGSGYSFTSSHAANHFGLACFLVLTLGRTLPSSRWWLWTWATIIGFAQVYVGVHFPLDIVGGALLGIALGILWAGLYHRYYPDLKTPSTA